MTPHILPGPPYPSQHPTPSGYPKSHCIPQGYPTSPIPRPPSPSPISQSAISHVAPRIPHCTLHPKRTSYCTWHLTSCRVPQIPQSTTYPTWHPGYPASCTAPHILQAPHAPQFCNPMISYPILHPAWHPTSCRVPHIPEGIPATYRHPIFHIPPHITTGHPASLMASHTAPCILQEPHVPHPTLQLSWHLTSCTASQTPQHPILPRVPITQDALPPPHTHIPYPTLHLTHVMPRIPYPDFLLQHHPKGRHLHTPCVTPNLIFPLLGGRGLGASSPPGAHPAPGFAMQQYQPQVKVSRSVGRRSPRCPADIFIGPSPSLPRGSGHGHNPPLAAGGPEPGEL